METQSRKTFYTDSDFIIEVEDYLENLLIHCEVFNWKPSVLRRGYSIFVKLEQYARDNGYTRMMTVTPNPKFAKLVGGTTTSALEYENKTHEVIVWELKQAS